MNETKTTPKDGGAAFSIQDILISLFKHKWKILLFTLLGLGAAVAVFFLRTPLYESRAKLLVKYVKERPGFDEYENIQDPSGRSGVPVMHTELTLLKSADLAALVADEMAAAGSTDGDATNPITPKEVAENLVIDAERGTSVISVAYRHENPGKAQEVLRTLITKYKERHIQVHLSGQALESVAEDRDEVRLRLKNIESELNQLKQDNRIAGTLTDKAVSLENQITSTLSALGPAEANLLAQEIKVRQLEKNLGLQPGESIARPDPGDLGDSPGAPLRTDLMDEYLSLSKRLGTLRNKGLELTDTFTERSDVVIRNREQIREIERDRSDLLRRHPELALRSPDAPASAVNRQIDELDLLMERASLEAQSKEVEVLRKQADDLDRRYEELMEDRPRVEFLSEQLQEEKKRYQLLSSSYDKAFVDRKLDPSNMPNIELLQHPSGAIKTYNDLTTKIMYGLAASGVVLGIGLALLMELLLDGRVKQSGEIETRLRMPLMLSIPYLAGKRRSPRLSADEATTTSNGLSGYRIASSPSEDPRGLVEKSLFERPPAVDESLQPYADAIRDRLGYYFELNDVTHKPKLIAFAGFTEGAGTTTLATSVAKSFAEDEDLKILLVDMNPAAEHANGNTEASSKMGRLRLGEDPKLTNLFVATAPRKREKGQSRALAPKSMHELMPKFRASDFDFILFDMPPVSPTSPTLAMAGLMDQVLLVLDGENTNRERLRRIHSQLVKGKADVACLFNKARRHAPRWIQAEV